MYSSGQVRPGFSRADAEAVLGGPQCGNGNIQAGADFPHLHRLFVDGSLRREIVERCKGEAFAIIRKFPGGPGDKRHGQRGLDGIGRIPGRIGIVGDQPLRSARKKTQQGNAVDAEEPQDRFQGASDLIVDPFGGKGDELRGEIGQELFELQALFGCSPLSWMYSILSVH